MKAARSAQLLTSARRGDWRQVSKLLQNRADPNVQGTEGISLLMLASKAGQVEACLEILQAGANQEMRDKVGSTALNYACSCTVSVERAVATVEALLAGRSTVDCRDSAGRTPLIATAEISSCVEVIQTLLVARADVNAHAKLVGSQHSLGLSKRATAAFFDDKTASALGNYMKFRRARDEEEERLLEAEQDISEMEGQVDTLDAEAFAGMVESLETELEAPFEDTNVPAAELNIESRYLETGSGLRSLFLKEMIDERDEFSSSGNPSVNYDEMDLFISMVAPLRMQDLALPRLTPEEIKQLRAKTAQLRLLRDRRYDGGDTALMVAARNGHVNICQVLLDHGAQAGYRDGNGESALSVAAIAGQVEVCQQLLPGASMAIREHALHVADKWGQEEASLALRGYEVLTR